MTEDNTIEILWDFVKFVISNDGDIPTPVACVFDRLDSKPFFISADRFETKEEFSNEIKMKVKNDGACAVAIVSSAWMVSCPVDVNLDEVTPSQHQDRQEIVLISFKTRGMNFIEIAPLSTTNDGLRIIGEIKRETSPVFNRFLDGIFDTVH